MLSRHGTVAQTARLARLVVAAPLRRRASHRFFSVATIGFVIYRVIDTLPFLPTTGGRQSMGVFAAAGLDFAELEQAASVDEDDEWTPPVVREPPAGRRQTKKLLPKPP